MMPSICKPSWPEWINPKVRAKFTAMVKAIREYEKANGPIYGKDAMEITPVSTFEAKIFLGLKHSYY